MTLWFDLSQAVTSNPPADGVLKVELSMAKAAWQYAEVRYCFYYEAWGAVHELPRDFVSATFTRFDAQKNDTANQTLSIDMVDNREGYHHPFGAGDAVIVPSIHFMNHYLPMLGALRQSLPLRVFSIIYDMIPWRFPQYSGTRAEPIKAYFHSLTQHCNHLFSISKASRHDYLAWADEEQYGFGNKPLPTTSVITLGTQKMCAKPIDPDILISELPYDYQEPFARLLKQPFILMVSTLNYRKSHTTLLRAYRYLWNAGYRQLPLLVWVGGMGDYATELLLRVKNDAVLQKSVLHFNALSDRALDALYRQCLFTVYPSLYEGWGLPIAESLAYGKHCLSGVGSSLSEVGEGFTTLLDPWDIPAWANALAFFVDNPSALSAKETQIAKAYQPPTWQKAIADIMQVANLQEGSTMSVNHGERLNGV